MKYYPQAALDALNSNSANVQGALELSTPTPFRVWTGFGDLVLSGNSFTGIGDNGLASVTGGALGTAEMGSTVSLSGVDPDALALVDLTGLRGVGFILYRLIFDATGVTLLSTNVHQRGRVDRLTRRDVPGGTSTIELGLEGAVRGQGRRRSRTRSDPDQRLISGTDSGFSRCAYAGEIRLVWGGTPPARAMGSVGGPPTYGPGGPFTDPGDFRFG